VWFYIRIKGIKLGDEEEECEKGKDAWFGGVERNILYFYPNTLVES
jgi:hypothetical protein